MSRNTRELLQRCLRTLLDGTEVAQTVIVVDNASTDGSAAMVRQAFPQVRLLASDRNLGFAAANNLALRQMPPTRYALLLNPDTEVSPGAVDALVAYLDRHPEVGAAGVQLVNPDGTPQQSYGHFYSFTASLWRNALVTSLLRRRPRFVEPAADGAVDVDWIVGACLMLRREALATVGLLDERFFVYGEEVDLQHRLHRAGWRVVCLPGVSVVHRGGQSARQAPVEAMLHEYRGRLRLVRKHTPPSTQVLYVLKAVAALVFWSLYWGGRALARGDAAARHRFGAYATVLRRHLNPAFYTQPT